MPNFIKSLSQAISSFQVKSVIDPLIKLFIFILLFILVGAGIKISEWIIICMACFEGLVLLLIFGAYVCFAIYKPDYLRSESYNLRKQSLSIIGDKENYKRVDMRNLVDIANPHLEETLAIKEKGGKDE